MPAPKAPPPANNATTLTPATVLLTLLISFTEII
jgi:hypothetical protein